MKTTTQQSQLEIDRVEKRDRAFTRTELLVVIVTVALLSGLLLTAVGRSDDNGSRMVCMNNLRQMGIAYRMYADDNNDRMAWPNWDGGSGEAKPPGWLYKPHDNGFLGCAPAGVRDPFDKVNNPGDTAWQEGLWYPYVKNPKVYLCPIDIKSFDYTNVFFGGRNNNLSSYTMNGAVAGYPYPESQYGYTTCRITDAWSPACFLMLEPDEYNGGGGIPDSFAYNDGAYFPIASMGIARLHTANGGELLTVGGNVQFLTSQQFLNEISKSGLNLAFWSPFSSSGGH